MRFGVGRRPEGFVMKGLSEGVTAATQIVREAPRRPLRVRFIRNPRAGRGLRGFTRLLKRHLSPDAVDYEVAWTRGRGDAETLAREAAAQGYDVVVAIGGDGTVNEVGRGLLGAEATSLAIIPTGSGNGFARHLRIPLSVPGALRRLNRPTYRHIDVGRINGHPFFCTAGLGFDAHVSKCFAESTRRGLVTYVRLALQEYGAYRPRPVRLTIDGAVSDAQCYVLAFANAAQYGNNAMIAPLADISDGLLDLCLIEEMPVRRALRVAAGLAFGDLPKSRAAIYHKSQEITVTTPEPLGFHVDGDYMGEAQRFDVTVTPLAISVCV
ncbi:diacylglycerol kinase family protein [Phenylobacterium sp.]|uniref:diacylglycerol/lipid kinase family protein n=1 Tax=Phenylobacterium sp. TaxID=1871053 RepID=UPI0025E5165D|nr:diacylglycerol kinase family protein [Phenylobacterium sp.]MBX3483752.1 diacylglycerol kinase family lipid kinase [Phenylobacterium sp.]MCW5759776.1 diacylglycerol kinase family lipid kinase [Phenylobacterium sp.]